MRLFFDTNVLASAFGSAGLCRDLMQLVLRRHELIGGEPVPIELRDVLQAKFRLPDAHVESVLLVVREGEVLPPGTANLPEVSDSKDVPILACALAGEVDAFVTGDLALLQLDNVEGMPLLSPRACYERLLSLA